MKRLTIFIFISFILVVTSMGYCSDQTAPVVTPGQVNTLMAVGDLGFCGIEDLMIKNPDYPWMGTKAILNKATILVGNLEVPLSSRGTPYTQKKWLLRADPRTALSLAQGGFKIVTLANNHIMDFGPIALQDNLSALDNVKILHTGAGFNLKAAREPVIITAPDGTRFAFLAYSLVYPEEFWASANRPGTCYGDPSYFIPDIKQAKTLADIVVVSFHWSTELQNHPADYQKVYGRECIDAGASVVLGSHPHVLQGLEVYHGGLIAYSLGNFVFGSYSKNVQDTIILAVDSDQTGLIQATIYPVNVNNYQVNFQPRLRHAADAERVLQDLRTFSSEFKTNIESNGEVGVINLRQ